MGIYRWLAASSLLLASIYAVACSSSDDTTTPPTTSHHDAGSSGSSKSDSGADSGSSGAACNTLSAGTDVSIRVVHGPVTGTYREGPIPDGTYNLTGAVVYANDGGDGGVDVTTNTIASTVVIKGTAYELAGRTSDKGETTTETGTITYSDENAIFTPTCNSKDDLKPTVYHADVGPDGFALVATKDGEDILLLFDKP